jgi:DNA-directed RNA polymerase specialized sigma24 family protein
LHISVADGANHDGANHLDRLELQDALDTLESGSHGAAEVVELKFFGGLTGEEIATKKDISLRTVNNDWQFAKAWRYRVLGSSQ